MGEAVEEAVDFLSFFSALKHSPPSCSALQTTEITHMLVNTDNFAGRDIVNTVTVLSLELGGDKLQCRAVTNAWQVLKA